MVIHGKFVMIYVYMFDMNCHKLTINFINYYCLFACIHPIKASALPMSSSARKRGRGPLPASPRGGRGSDLVESERIFILTRHYALIDDSKPLFGRGWGGLLLGARRKPYRASDGG